MPTKGFRDLKQENEKKRKKKKHTHTRTHMFQKSEETLTIIDNLNRLQIGNDRLRILLHLQKKKKKIIPKYF